MSEKKVLVKGLPPVTIVSDDEAEKVDFLVCMPLGPSPFNDNLTDFCCKCGIKVMYRWHAPRKPKKLCLDCMYKLEKKTLQMSEQTESEYGEKKRE